MKKILLAGAAAAAVLAGTMAFAQGWLFNDLEGGEWYNNAAVFALEHGYIKGINGNFAASKPVTRDQIAVMLQKFAYNVHFKQGEKVYKDPWYGFELTFPDSWQGYLVERNITDPKLSGQDEPRPKTSTAFGLLENNGIFWGLLDIAVWDKSAWENAKKLNTGHEMLGQNAEYVVSYLFGGEMDTPSELAKQDGDKLQIPPSFRWPS